MYINVINMNLTKVYMRSKLSLCLFNHLFLNENHNNCVACFYAPSACQQLLVVLLYLM